MNPLQYEDHDLATIFPLLCEEELQALAADIELNGQLAPITIFEGRVLDGRNRLRACAILGKSPEVKNFSGSDPLGYVLSRNLLRRHLDESQRAMIAAQISQHRAGGCAKLRNGLSQTEAAERLNISRRSVQFARQVLERGSKDLQHDVTAGQISVSAAVAQLPPKISGGPSSGLQEKLAKALERISQVCGSKVSDGIRDGSLTNVNEHEAIFWSGLSDSKMSEIFEFVVTKWWKPSAAYRFLQRTINSQTRIGDLQNRAIGTNSIFQDSIDGWMVVCLNVRKYPAQVAKISAILTSRGE